MAQNAELVFFSKWLKSPLKVASVRPSSAQLASAMAAALPENDGLVIELGGGTGAITQALLNAGVTLDRLVVIERDADFHRHLHKRFPGIKLLRGDALHLRSLLRGNGDAPLRAIVSGLPLLSMNAAAQRRLMQEAFSLTSTPIPFIQFTYGLASPLRKTIQHELGLSARCVSKVYRNLPPAKVWVYEKSPVQ